MALLINDTKGIELTRVECRTLLSHIEGIGEIMEQVEVGRFTDKGEEVILTKDKMKILGSLACMYKFLMDKMEVRDV